MRLTEFLKFFDAVESSVLILEPVDKHNLAKILTQNRYDVQTLIYSEFGITEALTVRDLVSRTSGSSKRVTIVELSSISLEAQNALLKVLEELPANSLFVFIVPSAQMLIATIRSRCINLGTTPTLAGGQAQEFIQSEPSGRRLAYLDADGEVVTESLTRLLDGLELEIGQKSLPAQAGILREIIRLRKLMINREISGKMALEQLVAIIPQEV